MSSDLPLTLSPALPVGHLLKEYSLLSVLGMGAFGITYLAADNYLHLKVAIKEFFPSSAAVRNQFSGSVALKSQQAQAEYLWGKERFMREAQTLARFHHKNIVQVFRYFEGNGTCYMVMAYEEGPSLEQVLTENRIQWDEQSTLALVMPLLDGMESVHEAGFLHRDIKPGNIVLRANEDGPVLIDFGAARSPTATDALTVVLSHGYGPPEQYSRQGNQGPWTDIYAMAGVLYRIVTGAVPPLSLHRLKNDAMIPAAFMGEGRFGMGFLQAIDLALNVDETRRPQSIAEWRRLLTRGASKGAVVVTAARAIDPGRIDAQAPPNKAGAKIASATSSISPGAGPSAAGHSSQSRAVQPRQATSEPGFFGRLGLTMTAHPFLMLLFLLASLFLAVLVARHSGSQHLNQPPDSINAAAPKPDVPKAEIAVIPQDHTRLIPDGSQSRRAEDQVPADNPPSAGAEANDSERKRMPPVEAYAACEGKAAGATCSFIDGRNERLSGTCVAPPGGSLSIPAGSTTVCRPERAGARGERRVGPLPYRQQGDQNPTDNRPPR